MGEGQKTEVTFNLSDKNMGRLLHDANHAEKILQITSETLLLINKDGRCVDISTRSNLWFLQEDKLLGSNIFKLLPVHTLRKILPEFQNVIRSQITSSKNYKLALENETHYFKCIMHPYEGMVLCQYRDITQRSNVKLELELIKQELLLAKEKAETSDKLKSAFLANMSHEIRTPLNAIVGFSRIIAESENAEERQEYYNIVETNNERLLQLINEILDLSKIESGIVDFKIGPVNLSRLCKDVYDAHIFRCPQGVKLEVESAEELNIDSDGNRLFQVLSNLIGNAFKFTTQGSISYGYKREGAFVRFHVTDTGIGIEPEKQHKVFERFAKLNTFAQGTGLGLSICKTIIERLGGSISVTSQWGKGTTFTFTLPYNCMQKESLEMPVPTKGSQHQEGSQPNVASPKAEGEITILIAEDTDSNYDLLNAILGKTYRLVRARDGMEAVSMFDEVKPDLILMDLKMPNLDGLEATKIIRELSPDVPIIAQSAYAYEHDRIAAEEAGCNDFLSKPIAQNRLKETITKWLNN